MKVWLAQIRANFLILSLFLVLIGLALSIKYPFNPEEKFNFLKAFLVLIGVVSAHISVNLFNEYSDFYTGIDFKTNRTPFSGGSGILVSGKNSPSKVLRVAIITLLISLLIGIYFSITAHWLIIIFALTGAFSIVSYTPFLAKNMLGELFAGLSLGTLVVLGTYISVHAHPGMKFSQLIPLEVYCLSIPPGLLTALLLFINEFPDMEADKQGGRKHLVIRLRKRNAAIVYAVGMFVTFAIILLLPVFGISSWWVYLALLPIPFAIKASLTALKPEDNISQWITALGNNVITVLATDLLIAVAIFIEVL